MVINIKGVVMKKPYVTTIVFTPETDQLIREKVRRKGDMSRIINELILKEFGTCTTEVKS